MWWKTMEGLGVLLGKGVQNLSQDECGVAESVLACNFDGPVLYEALRQLTNVFLHQ